MAVFVDQIFWFDGERYYTDEAFAQFIISFDRYFDNIVFCGRLSDKTSSKIYPLNPAKIEVCPIPYYEDIYSLWKRGISIFPKIINVISDEIIGWDIVWICAPHPISLIIAFICKKHGKPFFFMIRQNLVEQVKHRNKGMKKWVSIMIANLLEESFMFLARKYPTFTVGDEIYQKYKKGNQERPIYKMAVSLISESDIFLGMKARRKSFNKHTKIKLIFVGRLDPEKGIEYLLEAVNYLVKEEHLELIINLVGVGRDERFLLEKVMKLELDRYVRFWGYVPYGVNLLKIYRDADIFILPSLTGEGFPQVLLEAMACGLPVITTKVAGIPDLITDGVNGLLVDPGNSQQLAKTIRMLAEEDETRNLLIRSGFNTVRGHTLEIERDKMINMLQLCFPNLQIKRNLAS